MLNDFQGRLGAHGPPPNATHRDLVVARKSLGRGIRFVIPVRQVVADQDAASGRLAMHEVVAGTTSPVYYPVLWASGPEISHLRTEEETRAIIAASGLHEMAWINESDKARAFFAARTAALAARTSPPPLGLQVLIGPDYWRRTANFGRNLSENRIEIVQAVFEKPVATR